MEARIKVNLCCGLSTFAPSNPQIPESPNPRIPKSTHQHINKSTSTQPMRYLLLPLFGLLFFSCDKGLTAPQQLQADIEKIENYLADHNLTAQSTASGLHYIITTPGTGGHPSLSSNVTVRYTGKLLKNEKIFDQTNGTETTTFALSGVIEGWQEGIPLLQKGGKGTFFIPSALAYGPYGSGSIPANAPLIFEVELVSF